MTLPHERTMAVFKVQAFLSKLMTPKEGGYKGIPKPVREEARRLLKHYPMACDLLTQASFCSETVRKWATEMDRHYRGDSK